jgi:hypothetical protein
MNESEMKTEIISQSIGGDLWRMASIELSHLPSPWIGPRRWEGKGKEKTEAMTEREPRKSAPSRLRRRDQPCLRMN